MGSFTSIILNDLGNVKAYSKSILELNSEKSNLSDAKIIGVEQQINL